MCIRDRRVGVFGPQRVQRGDAGFLPDAQHVQQARDEAHVTHVQNAPRTNGRKAAHGQFNGLSLGIAALAANELQALSLIHILVFENPERGVRYLLVKPSDVAIYVEHGAADIGVVGKDVLLETQPDVYELLDLQLGRCRCV